MPKKQLSRGYPYTILPFPGDPNKISQSNPLCVNIYFLGEALLRSPKAMDAYREGYEHYRSHLRKLGIGYDLLKGEHHFFLTMDTSDPSKNQGASAFINAGFVADGILDLPTLARHTPTAQLKVGGEDWSLELLRSTDPRYLCLRLDASCSPNALIKRLRPLLQDRYEQVKNAPFDSPFARFYRAKTTPFRNISTWFQYFQCYDLRQSNLTVALIAERVYPDDTNALDKAKLAIRRVQAVIRTAEENRWPPRRFQ